MRPLELDLGVIAQAAGSARLHVGATDVIVGVEVGSPSSSAPNQGRLQVAVEFSPCASPVYQGRFGEKYGEQIAAAIESSLVPGCRGGPAGSSGVGGSPPASGLDLARLCILSGKTAWLLSVDALVLNDDGNVAGAVEVVTDAAGEEEIELDDSPGAAWRLDVSGVPLLVTSSQVGSQVVADLTAAEERCASASAHVAMKNVQQARKLGSQTFVCPHGGVRRAVSSKARAVSRQAQVVRAQAVSQAVTEKVANGVSAAAPGISTFDMSGDISKTVLGIILGGGAGTRLYPLTKKRAKPAVPLGANYRLIDIPVSNCLNSNITKIYCLTQFNSASLNRHLSQAYNSSVGGFSNARGFVEVLAASQSNANKSWFQGTADAVRQYMWLFEEAVREGVEDFLILSGDHLYRMDYRDFVRKHRESGAAITIAALPCAEKEASAFGLMKIDQDGRVVEFAEKPKGDALLKMKVDTSILGVDPATAASKPFIASMGIYVMSAKALRELLLNRMPGANDFGNEVIPGAKDAGFKVQAYAFDGYWEDIGTVEAFYNANLALADPTKAQFSFYDKDAPIYTMSRFLPPSKVLDADVSMSIIGDGCVIKAGSKINNSIIGIRSLVGSDCIIDSAMMMGADYYETLEECEFVPGCLPMGVGDGSIVRRAIIDKNARIGPKCQIINKDGVKEANREEQGFVIKDGIVVVIKDSNIPAGTII
ncbi:hypothetical protein GPECTOR_1g885 [Gonium pectorale]|uniref:Glucose-1-phosphate adenylyltransferase n=1 Tax=Gonium pectorale TaxID=33097 RepID=A0A150H5T1_GONPE|nr:hypothetical protein GPECTOR_1g885 [Gonium pectorale]|eukprot:KXZ56980.1 hypothetical protein GPECTOR_1g885 [Gonium pectorale]